MQSLINLYWTIWWKIAVPLHKFLATHSGTCYGAEGPCFQIGYRYRQNTAYVHEESNWTRLCSECQKVNDEYWADMWADYWSQVL